LRNYQDKGAAPTDLECSEIDPEVLAYTNQSRACENFDMKKLILIQETALNSVFKSKYNTPYIRRQLKVKNN
jgi:hypothetical protein